MNETQLILQFLICIIAKKKRQLIKCEARLMTCDNDYIQMYTCKSITNLIEKIKQFETLKLKYE